MYVRLNPNYGFLERFVRQFRYPAWFARNGTELHRGRNILKTFEVDGHLLVVKKYGCLAAFNRLIYGIFRKSKAERAFLHAERLGNLGIDTPEGIAVIDIRRKGVLAESYFVSAYTDYQPLSSVTQDFSQDAEPMAILDALAYFLFRLHWTGVLHEDLNVGNILYKRSGRGGYSFQLVDTNRMSFHRTLTTRQRIRNLRRLSFNAAAYVHILDRYAALIGANSDAFQLKGVFVRLIFEMRRRMKRRLKILVRL